MLLAPCVLAGCGGAGASGAGTTHPTAASRAAAYAHAINLRAGDLQGYTVDGSETEAPEPGRYDLEYHRCLGGVSSVRRLAATSSPEFATGRGLNSVIVKSSVEVWPTAGIMASHSARSDSAHGRSCLVRFVEVINRKTNLERKGGMRLGPFTLTTMPNPLTGVTHSTLTRIDETRLRDSGATFLHVHRDLFGFDAGRAEIELEAIGIGHPVPGQTEKGALHTLLTRALANASAQVTPSS